MTHADQIDHAAIVDRYIATWNETDAAKRRTLIAETFSEDVCYVDPMMRGNGHAELNAMIAAVHARFPDFRFTLVRAADPVDECVRFSWGLGPAGAPDMIQGTDIARVTGDGRFREVRGFLDRVPDGA